MLSLFVLIVFVLIHEFRIRCIIVSSEFGAIMERGEEAGTYAGISGNMACIVSTCEA